ELGVISREKFISEYSAYLTERRNLLYEGTQEPPMEELLNLAKMEQEAARAVTESILREQDRLRKIYAAMGASDDRLSDISMFQNYANLRDPNFQDADKRLEAATELVQQRVEAELRIAYEAGNLARVHEILNEGIDIDPLAAAEFYIAELEATQDYIDTVEEFSNLRKEAIVKQFGLLSEFRDKDTQTIAREAIRQIFTEGQLDDGTMAALESMLVRMAAVMPMLSPEAMEQFKNG